MGPQTISWRRLALVGPFGLLLSAGAVGQGGLLPPTPPLPPGAPAQIVATLREGADVHALRAAPGVRAVDAVFPEAVAAGRRSAARHAGRDARGPDGAAADVAAREAAFARTFVVRVDSGAVEATLSRLRQDPAVEYVERDGLITAQWVPNDPYFSTSGSWGQPHADLYGLPLMRVPQAWDLARGAGIVVAITDTGIDHTHVDIDGNVWANPGEIAGNGSDDDGNGFIDDVRGWDFHYLDADPMDRFGHGTHVAGVVAAEGNNAEGIVGTAPSARVMAVQVLGDNGGGSYVAGAQGIVYAVMNGADVVNASWGGSSPSHLLEEAVRYARDRGVLVVTSAGNFGLDAADFMPAGIPEAVTVAASDYLDAVPAFSNRGASIDVTAPGAGILSLRAAGTDPYGGGSHVVGGRYYWANGTSMSAGYVSGAIALLLSHLPTEKIDVTRDRLAFTADRITFGNGWLGGSLGGGRLNASRALTETLVPPALTISGRVVDRQGVPIRGATVALGEMGSQRVVTLEDGRYRFSNLRPGGNYAARTSQLGLDVLPGQTYYAELATSPTNETVVGVRRWTHEPIDTTWASGIGGLSLALDGAGQPRVAYYLPFENELRYAVRTSQGWFREIVETAAGSGSVSVGWSCSLAIDASGRPHIVYTRYLNGATQIRYARREASGWAIEDVPGRTGGQPRFVLDAAGRPHVVDAQSNPDGSLVHYWKDASGWHEEPVVDAQYLLLSDLAVDAQGRLHIAYQANGGAEQIGPGFWHAVRDASGWHHTLADAMPFAGDKASIDFVGGSPRLAYRYWEANAVNPSLRYGTSSGGTWQSEIVDPGAIPIAVSLTEGIAGGPLLVYNAGIGLSSALGLGYGGWYRQLVHRGLTGAFTDMTRGADGSARLVYNDQHSGFLWHARSLELLDPAWLPPVAAFTTPGQGATIAGVVALRANAQSPLGLYNVDFLLDGNPLATVTAVPYAFEWDTRTVSNGVHLLTVKARDTTGAVATQTIAVKVLNAATR